MTVQTKIRCARLVAGLILVAALCTPGANAQTTIPFSTPACPAATQTLGSSVLTVPCSLNLLFTASTAPNPLSSVSPMFMGVNSGHNNDTSWQAFMRRLNANAVRIFGLAGNIPQSTATSTGLQTWVTAAGAPWGADLNGSPVTSLATFNSAIATFRTYAGHTPGQGFFANPPRWATFEAMQDTNSAGPSGGSMSGEVAALQAMGINPLLVFWLSCTNFAFSTLDVSRPAYWAEHWCAAARLDDAGGTESCAPVNLIHRTLFLLPPMIRFSVRFTGSFTSTRTSPRDGPTCTACTASSSGTRTPLECNQALDTCSARTGRSLELFQRQS